MRPPKTLQNLDLLTLCCSREMRRATAFVLGQHAIGGSRPELANITLPDSNKFMSLNRQLPPELQARLDA